VRFGKLLTPSSGEQREKMENPTLTWLCCS